MKFLFVLPFAVVSVAAMAFVPASDPLTGWHAFVKLCNEHGGPTDVVRAEQWDGKDFVEGDTWRIECGDVEVVIPASWFNAGTSANPSPAPSSEGT